MLTDPIADMLTRIRNAAQANHEAVRIPLSKIKHGIGEILKREGYVGDVHLEEAGTHVRKSLVVALKYEADGSSAFRSIRRVSRPGRRVYTRGNRVRHVLNGLGTAIVSTSHGLMTDREARSRHLGGEILCEVW